METKRAMIEGGNHIKDKELGEAAGILRSGSLVAFPTEAVCGLGSSALDEDAAREIYITKGRPSDNPLIAHVSCVEEVAPLVKEIPEADRKLVEAFWPGSLTMISPKSDKVLHGTTGGLDTVATHMPDDPMANRPITLVRVPMVTSSADTSGRPSPTTADHVQQDMDGRIEMTIDGGPVGIGMESTIVDVSSAAPAVLRPGATTAEMLEAVLGDVSVSPAILDPLSADVRPKTPRMKYRHYVPRADPILTESEDVGQENRLDKKRLQVMIGKVWELFREEIEAGCKVGVICMDGSRYCYADGAMRSIGERKGQASVAHSLCALLRESDDLGVGYIFSESFPKDHLGQAIMNRPSKAAGYKIVEM